MVAGGGGGGDGGGGTPILPPSPPTRMGGGGGAGGFIYEIVPIGTSPYPVVVGSGGAARANGSNTTGFSLTATGGGCGGGFNPAVPTTGVLPAGNGGSGGGTYGIPGTAATSGGTGTSFQGFAGAGTPSFNSIYHGGGGAGSTGYYNSFTASPSPVPDGYAYGGQGRYVFFPGSAPTYTWVAGGGGGAVSQNPPFSTGGQGGGGSGVIIGGSAPTTTGATAGTANTGGGGGGGAGSLLVPAPLQPGKSGGSGVIYVRFKSSQ